MAVMSFPNGSAVGQGGLRPQHLKDLMLGVAEDNPLLVAINDLVNLLLQGKSVIPIRDFQFDFKNALSTLRRDSILEAVAKYCPELLAFAQLAIGQASVLQFGDFVLQSAEGAQQGDPLRPLYFCPTFKELLESRQSKLIIGYLIKRRGSWWQCRVRFEWFHTTRSCRQTTWSRIES